MNTSGGVHNKIIHQKKTKKNCIGTLKTPLAVFKIRVGIVRSPLQW